MIERFKRTVGGRIDQDVDQRIMFDEFSPSQSAESDFHTAPIHPVWLTKKMTRVGIKTNWRSMTLDFHFKYDQVVENESKESDL